MARLAINSDTGNPERHSSSSRPSSSSSASSSDWNNNSNNINSEPYNSVSASYLSQKVEIVKRKYLTQNRVLAKSNSELMMKVNQLEEKVSQLIRENLQLRHNDRKNTVKSKQKLTDVVNYLEYDVYSKFKSMFDVFDELRSKENLSPSNINFQSMNRELVSDFHLEPSGVTYPDPRSSASSSSENTVRPSLPTTEDEAVRKENLPNRRKSSRRQSSLFIQIADNQIEKVDDVQTNISAQKYSNPHSGSGGESSLQSQESQIHLNNNDTQNTFEQDLYENSTTKQVTEYVIPEEEGPEENMPSCSQSQLLSQRSNVQPSQATPSQSSQVLSSSLPASQPEFQETLDARLEQLSQQDSLGLTYSEPQQETSVVESTNPNRNTRLKLKTTRKASRIHSLAKHSPFKPLPPNELETMPSSPSLSFMSGSISGNSSDRAHKNNVNSNSEMASIQKNGNDEDKRNDNNADDPFESKMVQYTAQRTSKKTQNSINKKSNCRLNGGFKPSSATISSDSRRGSSTAAVAEHEKMGGDSVRSTRKRKSIIYTEPSLRKKMRRESEKFVNAVFDEPLEQQERPQPEFSIYQEKLKSNRQVPDTSEDEMIHQSETLSPVRFPNKKPTAMASKVPLQQKELRRPNENEDNEGLTTIQAPSEGVQQQSQASRERQRLRNSLAPSDTNDILGGSLINGSKANRVASERRKSMVMMFTKRRQSIANASNLGSLDTSSDTENKENKTTRGQL